MSAEASRHTARSERRRNQAAVMARAGGATRQVQTRRGHGGVEGELLGAMVPELRGEDAAMMEEGKLLGAVHEQCGGGGQAVWRRRSHGRHSAPPAVHQQLPQLRDKERTAKITIFI